MYLLTEKLKESIIKYVNIKIDYSTVDAKILDQIEDFSKKTPGKHSTVLHLITEQGKSQKILSHELKLSIEEKSIYNLRKLLGNQNVWLSL
jgi:hypothetical protein